MKNRLSNRSNDYLLMSLFLLITVTSVGPARAADPSGRSIAGAAQSEKISNCISHGNEGNPGVYPPCSTPYGLSYAEWSANWWRWIWSVPSPVNPILDTTGQYCAEGQTGPVWYLAGTFGGPVERSCTIPAGVSILFPVFNVAFGDGDGDCNGVGPFRDSKLPSCFAWGEWARLVTYYSGAMDNPYLQASIDGRQLVNLLAYRAQSPQFWYVVPANNILGHPAGLYFPAGADGYWVMSTPLSPGRHEIHFKTAAGPGAFFGFSLEVTYHLTVR